MDVDTYADAAEELCREGKRPQHRSAAGGQSTRNNQPLHAPVQSTADIERLIAQYDFLAERCEWDSMRDCSSTCGGVMNAALTPLYSAENGPDPISTTMPKRDALVRAKQVNEKQCCKYCKQIGIPRLEVTAKSLKERMEQYRRMDPVQSSRAAAAEVLEMVGSRRNKDLLAAELQYKCDALQHGRHTSQRTTIREEGRKHAAQQRVSDLTKALQQAVSDNDQPRFLKLLSKAYRAGALENQTALKDIIEGVGAALVHGRQHRRLNKTQKLFFTCLLNYGGPLVHDFASQVLLGPHQRTTQRVRAAFFQYGLGMEERHFQHAAQLLKDYGCSGVPCMVAEDASALQVRLEPIIEQCNQITIYDLNGPCLQVNVIMWLYNAFHLMVFSEDLMVMCTMHAKDDTG